MAAPGRLLPEGVVPPAGGALDAKGSISAFVATLKCVELPALSTRCWLLPLADGAKVFIFEETLGPENFACDCCRIVGWQGHPVSTKNWHFIVPAEEGQYSLADPTSLCAIADARARGLQGSAHVALSAPDPDAPHHHQSSSVFESKMHRLHGTVHSNGYGHLMRLNGREGGSKRASGRQLMQLWDDLCDVLRVRQVSTEDVSNKAGMELRVLHTAARRMTWYGQWHYGFGRGGFNMSPQQWQAAIDYVHSAPVGDVLADFEGIDATVVDILQRYQDAEAAPGDRETLGRLLSRMLGLLSKPDPMLPVFEAAATAERERQRMLAEQRMLMAAYLEQQRQLAVQQAQHPLDLSHGPTAAYFGVSQQQQELQRQQQELFALACQPVAQQPAAPANGALPAAAAAPLQQAQEQQPQPMETEGSALHASDSLATASLATDPEGEAAAPSGEPELRAAAATEKAAAEAADEELALARATAQAAIAAALRAVDGHAPGVPEKAMPAAAAVSVPEPPTAAMPPLTAEQVAVALAAQQLPASAQPAAIAAVPVAVPALTAAQLAAAPAAACLSPPPPPPLPASAAAAAADEVDQWLAPYSSDSDGGKEAGGSEGPAPVAGVLHCRRAAGAGEPPLADSEGALAPAFADGGVLRLRGGGGRKRPASAGGDADDGDAAKRQHVDGGGPAEEAQRFGPEVVGRSLMVYWKEQKTYYTGSVTKYHPDSGKHTIVYRDGDKETLELHKERFKWSEKEAVHAPDAAPKGAKPGRRAQAEKEATPAAEAGADKQAGKRGKRAGTGSRKSSVQDELPEAAAAAATEEQAGQQPRARGRRAQKQDEQEQQQEQQGGGEHAAGRQRRSRTDPAPHEAPTRQQLRRHGTASPAPPPEGTAAAEQKAAEVAAKVASNWKHPHIPPPPKPLGGASLRAYIKRQEGLLGLTPGSSAAATPAPQPAAEEPAAEAAGTEPMDEDAAAAGVVAAAAVARVVQADAPAAPGPAGEAEAETEADAAAAVAAAVSAAADAQAAAQQETTLSTEQLAAAAARQPKDRSKEEKEAEVAAGKAVLGCASCRYATAGCKRCRPRLIKELGALGTADARLALLGKCGHCSDPQHGCLICWRMVVLSGDHAKALHLFEEAKAAAEATAESGAHLPQQQQQQQPARGKRKQHAAQGPLAEQPEPEQPAKKQHAAEADASLCPAEEARMESAAADTPAAAAEEDPASPEVGSTAGGGQRKKKGSSTEGKQLVDEAVKAEVNAARARGEIVLGCGRCRYRNRAGCIDCRHKALLQMRLENLTEGLELVGCAECSGSDQGCRHCWPAAVTAAQRQRSARPAEQRAPPPEKAQQQQQKAGAGEAKAASKPPKAPKAVPSPAGVRALKEAAAAAAAGGSPATAAQLAAAAAAGAGSASSRRNKALLAVNREATMGAHAAGKYALGCGRCRWSMTGGCNNCRSKQAEEMRKNHSEWAARLGCEHCEGSKDGCPHCWKEVLIAMGDLALRQPPVEKVEAAIKYIPALGELEEDGEAAEDRPQLKPAKRQRADKAAKQLKQEEGEEEEEDGRLGDGVATAAAAAGLQAKWGSKVEKCPIRIWWPADSMFYDAVVTSYKQGLHRVLYDEDGHAEKLDLLEHRFQVQLLHGGPWLEYDQGVPMDETSRLAAVAAGAMPATAAPLAAPGQPVEQPLGVPVKDLLQKRVRVLCSDVGQWKAGVVVGFNHGKFAINFDDGSKARFFLQYEQWEPLDLDLLEQRQQAQRAAAQEAAAAVAAAAAATGAAAVAAPRQRSQRASALLPPGGYGSFLEEDAEAEHVAPAAGQLPVPPPVPGAASGLPPPASPQPRTVEQLPEPLPLSPEAEKARKYKFGLHRYVGQRVRLWSEEAQDWREGVITSFGQNRHKVQLYDGSKSSFSMQTDAYQLLPQPGSPAEAGPVLPPAVAPELAPAEPMAPPAGSTRRAAGGSLPPKGIRPPSGGPPILPEDALPIFRDRLQPAFALPPCTQPFTLDKIVHVLRLTLARLKDYPGQWVPKSYLRHYLNAAGVRDNSLMDYCGKSLECVTLDGWAVYRNRSPQYNCLYYLAEKVGDDTVLTDIAEPPRAESIRRGPRKASADPAQLADAVAPAAALPAVAVAAPAPEQREQRVIPTRAAVVHHQAPPPQQRPQRRFAGYNVRRGGGALSPRTTVGPSGGPRRQQPWQMLLPAGVPPTPLTPEQCRHQVMADLVYLFNNVLRQYRPAVHAEAQRKAQAAGGGAAEPAPLRTPRLGRLQEEVQVLRDCKHFIKLGSGERFGELPTPAGMVRLLCHIRMPEEAPEDENGENEPAWAPPVRPPPEVLLLPADATLGQLLDAATAAFRGSYRMCANWTADAVVEGLSVAVPPPPRLPPPPPPLLFAAPAAGDAMEVDGGAQAEAAPALAATGPGPEAMDVDAAPAALSHAAAAAAAADPEAQLAAAVAAAAVAAAVRGLNGPAAAAEAAAVGQATQQLAAVQLDRQQAQQGPQLSAEELAQRAQQDGQRAALLATLLADMLLPPAQQQEQPQAADPGAAPAAGSVAAAAAQAAAQLPSVVVDGHGLDWAIRWRHAGGLEDWEVRCRCGVRDDDGERMIMCDTCNIWQHTRCYHIADDQPVPEHQFTCDTCRARGVPVLHA